MNVLLVVIIKLDLFYNFEVKFVKVYVVNVIFFINILMKRWFLYIMVLIVMKRCFKF